MNILLAGGSGFVGKYLIRSLTNDGHTVTVLSRNEKNAGSRYLKYEKWNGREMPLSVKVGVFDGVINLAGASIADKKWTDSYKKVLLNSRIESTLACVNYINQCTRKPLFFLNASAIGYYGGDVAEEVQETSPSGTDFMGQLCKKWEDAAEGALCRTVKLRIGIVLGKGGGALPQLVGLHQKYIGGRIASGKQGISWIHVEDLIRAIRFVMDTTEISGPVNLTSPNWITQSVFAQSIDKAIGKKNIFFIPKFALDIVLGERAIIVWGGQKVRPQRLVSAGFTYNFTEIDRALEDLLAIKED